MIRLEKVSSRQRTLLWNLHQKYLHEMTNYYDDELDGEGNYHYGYFDEYFTDPERTALLIYWEQRLVGFAMIHPYSYVQERPDHVLAEFTIFPRFRRRHLARAAAEGILASFPGRWEIKYHEKNTAARNLWNQIAAQYQPERCSYSPVETVLCFLTE